MNAVLSRIGDDPQESHSIDAAYVLTDIKEQIRLSGIVAGILPDMLVKISECYESGSELSFPKDTKIGVSFFGMEGENLVFNCSSNLKISLPLEFIESLDEDASDNLDFLISHWRFFLNNNEIHQDLWNDNPYIHSGRRLGIVPIITRDILSGKTKEDIESRKIALKKEIKLRRKFASYVRSAFSSAVRKLLPVKIKQGEILEYNSKGIEKMRQGNIVKFPRIEIRSR